VGQDGTVFSDLNVAVLAGGLGTRLRSVIAEQPKALAQVHGRPFLAYLLDQLAAAGFSSVLLCTGHFGQQIEDVFGATYGSLQISYSRESRPLGTGGALRLARRFLSSDPVLVMNGDSFCAADLRELWDRHCTRGAKATMLLTQVADAGRYGSVMVDSDGTVTRFSEKGRGVSGLINAGVYLLSRRIIDSIAEDAEISLEYDVFPNLVRQGLLSGCAVGGRFLDIGTPEDFAAAEEFFTARKSRERTDLCRTR
jgi:NDP-sugar pyrophosphorylase family protein